VDREKWKKGENQASRIVRHFSKYKKSLEIQSQG